MLQLINVSIDHGRLGAQARSRMTERRDPLFSWGALSSRDGARQAACRLCTDGFWDSGWVEQAEQEIRYAGAPLPEGERVAFALTIRDDAGEESLPYHSHFFCAGVDWRAPWIGVVGDRSETVRYFSRPFHIARPVADACLYACGIGYSRWFLNGAPVDAAALDPAFTEWKKTCQYVMFPEIASLLRPGANELGAMLGAGWRHNPKVLPGVNPDEIPYDFCGPKMLTAMLRLTYEGGETEWICSDDAWHVGEGPLICTSLFDGVLYNAAREVIFSGNADVVEGPGGVLRPMLIPPIREHAARAPIACWKKGGAVVMDFGQNLAGVLRVALPENLSAGQEIVLTHAEELDEDGDLYTLTLRAAEAKDRYIAAGNMRDLAVWQPEFTYHGFRYAKIEGLGGGFDAARHVKAVELRTDLETRAHFRCGNALVTKIHEICVETERSNMHSILTDCPQRNERMGWMNDATVRFEETPYNFDTGRMFPKIIRDIIDEQGADGAITCTAPFAYGSRPADPVCSSFLMAGLGAALHGGDLDIVRETYEKFEAWENCLLAHSDGFIVNYSYYGDWAGPLYACEYIDKDHPGARAIATPGAYMSSGYSYLNCVLLARFADWLGRPGDAARHAETAKKIKDSVLYKWYDGKTGVMATGSQACQAFALCLGLIPPTDTAKAAKVLHDDLVRGEYRLTTGNLCSRYILDVLAEHGYLEDAWRLLTREAYPSLGYMIGQEATTVWERFELMKNPNMNSHNHPMYAAADYFLYAYLAGVKPVEPGWTRFIVEPYMPEGLFSAQAVVDTVKGEVSVRWTRRYGARHLHVTVPFGTTATIRFCGLTREVGSGFHAFTVEEEKEN
jgi:alpha-L-rhamnosidase